MDFPLTVAVAQAKMTENIPRVSPCVCVLSAFVLTLFTDVHPTHFCWMGVQLLSREHSARSLLQHIFPHQWNSDNAMNGHGPWGCQQCAATSAVVPLCLLTQNRGTAQAVKVSQGHRISRSSCQECSSPVHQKTRVQETKYRRDTFFPKRSHGFLPDPVSLWKIHGVLSYQRYQRSTQTRFSTFLLIMHDILRSAVCLWWCKMLRSHYNNAQGDYFLISIIT